MAKIALIDDSSATLEMLSSILKGAGHSVQTFSSGVGAEDKLAADTPNLVLLDVVMPERNGYEVLRGLKRKAETKTVPVIMVTSKGEGNRPEPGRPEPNRIGSAGAADLTHLRRPHDRRRAPHRGAAR